MEEKGVKSLRVVVELLFLLILVYSPLAFGSAAQVYRPPIWLMSFALLFTHQLLKAKTSKEALGTIGNSLPCPPKLVLYAFFGFLALQVIFLIPLPGSIFEFIYPCSCAHDGGNYWIAIHPSAEIGTRALLDWSSAVILFFVAATFPNNRKQILRLLFTILAVAGFEAIYGIIEYAGSSQRIFNYTKVVYLDAATGTFINRNHYANYIGMAICLSIAIIFYFWSKRSKNSGMEKSPLEIVLLLTFYLILLVVALFLSKSRAGLLSVAVTITVGIIAFARGHKKAMFGFVAAVILLSLIFSFYIGEKPSVERFFDLPAELETKDARPAVWGEAIHIWKSAPFFGVGAGTFSDTVKTLGTGRLLARYIHAHNDYLQILAEFGLAGFLLLFTGIFGCIIHTVKHLNSRNDRFARLIAFGAVAAVATWAVHSMFDFNLQIPANRITMFTILGFGYLVASKRMAR